MDRQRIFGGFGGTRAEAFKRARLLLGTSAVKRAFSFVCGFALSFASLMEGIAPFGVAYVAVCGGGPMFAALGAICGYMLCYGTAGLSCAAAVAVCCAGRIVFRGTRAVGSQLFMPMCAFIALMCTKGVVALQQGLRGMILLLCECVLCFGFCILAQMAADPDRENTAAALWGKVAVAAAVMLIFRPVNFIGDINPARIAAGFAVMTVSCFGGSAFGAGAGAVFGACMDISGGEGPFFVAAYGFSGLIGGIGGRRGRFLCAMCHVLANTVATMWGSGHPLAFSGLFECFIASVVFVLLPDSVFNKLQFTVRRDEESDPRPAVQRAFAMDRLRAVSQAVGELGGALDTFLSQRTKENVADITKVYDRAAERVCRRCSSAALCWDRDYMTTCNALNDVTMKLRLNNFLREQDFPPHFAARCIDMRQFCGAINDEYHGYIRRAAAVRRDNDARSLMSRQYSSLQGVLKDMAGSVSTYPEYYPALEARIRDIAKAYSPLARVAVYSQAGRMHVEISAPGDGAPLPDEDAFLQSLTLALKKRFCQPQVIAARSGHILRISECEKYTAAVTRALRKKSGEEVCGDTVMQLHTDDGRAVVLLSDGMGTGDLAGEMSQKALELISGFVKSGCSLYESARAVIPVLTARFEQWGFVTLDLLEINLFTGHANIVKYGAAPSLLLRGNKCTRLSGEALPAGLESPAADPPQPIAARLQNGDRVIMLSDGVWENGDCEALAVGGASLQPNELISKMMASAAQAGAVDDMSAIVVTLAQA